LDVLIDLIVEIWRFDPGLAVVFVLAMIGFLSTTVLIITKTVKGAIAATKQVHAWMRESGRLTRPEAPTPDLGGEPPALVNLLLTHGRSSRAAVRATVLDLAARGAVTLYQPDADPLGTVVTRLRPLADELADVTLTAYERRVLAELRAVPRGTQLSALPMSQPTGMRRWHRQFRREVQADARGRGLTYLDTSIVSKTIAATFVPCTVIGFFTGLGAILVVVYIVATIVVGERSRVWLTRDGREALGRWLGVRSWLQAHEVFADLPPAAVAVWGRYLAYGAAMDVIRAPARV
jgi:Predicted membrane protein (DUF2207)